MPTKERAKSHLNEKKALEIFKNALPAEWVSREYSPDYGIDLSIELFSETDGKYYTQGEHIYIQLKSIENPRIKKLKVSARYNVEESVLKHPTATDEEPFEIDVIKYQIETSLLETVEKMGSAVPVMLILVNVNTQDIYYICLNDYIEKIVIPEKSQYFEQKSITLNIPLTNIIDKSTGRSIIEWYAKRPKLFAFFNKVAYQYHEIERHKGDIDLINHFATIIARLDAWSAAKYFPWLNDLKIEFFYCEKTKRTLRSDLCNIQLSKQGWDLESEEWEDDIFSTPVSLKASMEMHLLNDLWRRMDNIGRIFEDIMKETHLPTYVGCSLYLL